VLTHRLRLNVVVTLSLSANSRVLINHGVMRNVRKMVRHVLRTRANHSAVRRWRGSQIHAMADAGLPTRRVMRIVAERITHPRKVSVVHRWNRDAMAGSRSVIVRRLTPKNAVVHRDRRTWEIEARRHFTRRRGPVVRKTVASVVVFNHHASSSAVSSPSRNADHSERRVVTRCGVAVRAVRKTSAIQAMGAGLAAATVLNRTSNVVRTVNAAQVRSSLDRVTVVVVLVAHHALRVP